MGVGSSGVIGWPVDPGILDSRAQRVLLASLVGAALSAAGVAYQAVLRNHLADPYLLGVAAGASLGSYLWKFPLVTSFLITVGEPLASISKQSLGFLGAMLAAGVVFGVSAIRGRLQPTTLILTGVIVSSLVASVMLLLYTLAGTLPGSGSYQSVLVGELQSNLEPAQIWTTLAILVVTWLVLLSFAGKLNLSRLGDDESRSLGLRPNQTRWIVMTSATLMTAAAVAISGPIGFVGLICPHLGRVIVGTDSRRLLPVATAIGAGLLVLADAMSRYAAAVDWVNTILPIGVITSLLGGPFFLVLLIRSNQKTDVA